MERNIYKIFKKIDKVAFYHIRTVILFTLTVGCCYIVTSLHSFLEEQPVVTITYKDKTILRKYPNSTDCEMYKNNTAIFTDPEYKFDSFIKEFNIMCDFKSFNLIFIFYYLGSFLGALIFFIFIDRIGRKLFLIISMLIYSASMLGIFFNYNYTFMVILFLLNGIPYSCIPIITITYITEITVSGIRPVYIAIIIFSTFVIDFIINLLALNHVYTWRYIILIDAILILVICIAYIFFLEESPNYLFHIDKLDEFKKTILNIAEINDVKYITNEELEKSGLIKKFKENITSIDNNYLRKYDGEGELRNSLIDDEDRDISIDRITDSSKNNNYFCDKDAIDVKDEGNKDIQNSKSKSNSDESNNEKLMNTINNSEDISIKTDDLNNKINADNNKENNNENDEVLKQKNIFINKNKNLRKTYIDNGIKINEIWDIENFSSKQLSLLKLSLLEEDFIKLTHSIESYKKDLNLMKNVINLNPNSIKKMLLNKSYKDFQVSDLYKFKSQRRNFMIMCILFFSCGFITNIYVDYELDDDDNMYIGYNTNFWLTTLLTFIFGTISIFSISTELMGRKRTLICLNHICSITFLIGTHSKWFSAVDESVYTCVKVVLYIYCNEIFPTVIRPKAFSICFCCYRFASILSSICVYFNKQASLDLLFLLLTLFSSTLCFFLTETVNKPIKIYFPEYLGEKVYDEGFN